VEFARIMPAPSFQESNVRDTARGIGHSENLPPTLEAMATDLDSGGIRKIQPSALYYCVAGLWRSGCSRLATDVFSVKGEGRCSSCIT